MQMQQDFLAPQQLQTFVAGLAGLSPNEIRKAKSLYIRNAISEYKAFKASLKAFGVVQIIFAIIPFFWPILWLQRVSMNAGMKLYEERIQNALAVWQDDLGDEADEFARQLAQI